jgi:hypothetical protein
MGMAARKLLQLGMRVVKESPDFGNPINVDTTEFMVEIGKGALNIIKEVLF